MLPWGVASVDAAHPSIMSSSVALDDFVCVDDDDLHVAATFTSVATVVTHASKALDSLHFDAVCTQRQAWVTAYSLHVGVEALLRVDCVDAASAVADRAVRETRRSMNYDDAVQAAQCALSKAPTSVRPRVVLSTAAVYAAYKVTVARGEAVRWSCWSCGMCNVMLFSNCIRCNTGRNRPAAPLVVTASPFYPQAPPVLAPRRDLHVFVDYCNVFMGARHTYGDGYELSVADVVSCVELQPVTVAMRVVAGNLPACYRGMWTKLGYAYPKDTSGMRDGPANVDEWLHAQILTCIASRLPATLVLVTGDGNNNNDLSSFPKCCMAALKAGWRVEVVSWRITLHSVYHALQVQSRKQLQVRLLDDYVRPPLPLPLPPPLPRQPTPRTLQEVCQRIIEVVQTCTLDPVRQGVLGSAFHIAYHKKHGEELPLMFGCNKYRVLDLVKLCAPPVRILMKNTQPFFVTP
jgi:hypothetical protein